MPASHATFTSDFRHEYQQAQSSWLRRRFLWYTGVIWTTSLLLLLISIAAVVWAATDEARTAGEVLVMSAGLAPGIVATILYLLEFVRVRRSRLQSREDLLRRVVRLILIAGGIGLLASVLTYELAVRVMESRAAELLASKRYLGLQSAGRIFLYHLFACLFLPWTPRESLRPIWPLLVLNALIALIYASGAWVLALVTIVLSPLVALPGVGICAWRQSRFKDSFTFRMLKSRYGEIRQELHSARQIHESLFPRPLYEGPTHFDFRYEPMRQIGGDYLYARAQHLPGREKPVLNIVLIDVTGHGITAALTVNRLYGEIEREFGENPSTPPGDLLSGLNAYLHHTLATHSVYATALCCRIDPNDDVIEWASAGHPPGFIKAVDGTVHRLDSTTFVLGACRGDDFRPEPQRTALGPGDRVILYTDGAIEARNPQGKMLTVAGLEKLVAAARDANANGTLLDELLTALERYRDSPPADDTLLVEIVRPV